MDVGTVAIYERTAARYRAERKAYQPGRAAELATALPAGSLRLDLGCGPGLYADLLGSPMIAADAAHAMLQETSAHSPEALPVQCDLVALPLRTGSIAGVWASKAHQHLAAADLPGALGEIHRVMPVGGRLDLTMFANEDEIDFRTSISGDDDRFPGRLFTFWAPVALLDLLVGAGFDVIDLTTVGRDPPRIQITALRARTLADSVGPGMRLMICGLNPSLYAADAGVAFARPGNRFWPALRAAGLTDLDRDPRALLRDDRIGMTDLVKRATIAASELTTEEYRDGLSRIERLCRLLEPEAVCFVGLAGWRSAVDRKATPGWQTHQLGPTSVYLMPSTSGLNARTLVDGHAENLRRAVGTRPI